MANNSRTAVHVASHQRDSLGVATVRLPGARKTRSFVVSGSIRVKVHGEDVSGAIYEKPSGIPGPGELGKGQKLVVFDGPPKHAYVVRKLPLAEKKAISKEIEKERSQISESLASSR